MTAASADASPSSEDSLHRSESSTVPRVRLGIDTISDVVFGLALEIGSIAIVTKVPQTSTDLAAAVVEFGFSFVVVFMAWFAYRRAIIAFPYETPRTLIVNVALLFCVSIEPFLFYVLVVAPGTVGDAAPVAFTLDLGAMMLLLSLFTYLLMVEERRAPRGRVHPAILQQARASIIGRAMVGVVFLICALPVFGSHGPFGEPIREDVWVVGLALFVIFQQRTALRLSHENSVGK